MDQRRHYRVTESDLEHVISELLAGPQRLQSRVLDISIAGAALLLPGVTDPRWAELIATLSETGHCQLRIITPSLPEPLVLVTRILHTRPTRGGLLLGVAFRPEDTSDPDLDATLLRIFNRRGAQRMAPHPRRPVLVALGEEPRESAIQGVLRDLSVTGLGLTLPMADALSLREGQRYQCRFDLHEVHAQLNLPVTVRFCRQETVYSAKRIEPYNHLVVGVEFDRVARRRPDNSLPIQRWIADRQLDPLPGDPRDVAFPGRQPPVRASG